MVGTGGGPGVEPSAVGSACKFSLSPNHAICEQPEQSEQREQPEQPEQTEQTEQREQPEQR